VRKLAAFLRRDFRIETSYRFAFVLQWTWILLSTCSYYYLARFIGKSVLPGTLDAYGGDYFAFVLVGVALDHYHGTSLDAFSRSIRDSQLDGTLEALLATQTSLSTIIILTPAYRFVMTTVGVLLYLGLGVVLFGLPLGGAHWGAAALFLALAIVVFSSIGIFSASFVMIFKRGSPIPLVLGGLSWLLGGVLYPVSVLPKELQAVSAMLPVTYAIDGMRSALIRGASWSAMWKNIGPLLGFAVVLLPLSLWSFRYATRRARIMGTLSQY
jgi:ABC-2 type transport system permease protein